jgi:hypothetical protein
LWETAKFKGEFIMELKRYDKGKDGPAGSSIDLKARIMAADLKITYSEAMALAFEMHPDEARKYLAEPNETVKVYMADESKNGALDSAAQQYMKTHPDVTYSEAVAEVLSNQPGLLE